VKACNSDGVWNEDGASLAVNVRPSFWQTWWFRAGATGLAIGLVAAGVRAITARKARRKLAEIERRHALERERARIAKDIHDDLGASLTHITMLSQSARLRPEASTQPGGELEQIYGTARELTRAMEEVVWAVSPRHDTLESLLAYITSYAQDFAAAAGVRCRWDLPQAFSHRPLSSPERHNAFLAFKEALHNVAKHAGATELKISLKLEPEAFVLVVEDNGHGFARHGENGSAGAPNGERLRHVQGFGMANMRSRMEEIGGSCEIQTRPGLGTSVRLLVPLSHK
jgi:signal transduction histidine kinase